MVKWKWRTFRRSFIATHSCCNHIHMWLNFEQCLKWCSYSALKVYGSTRILLIGYNETLQNEQGSLFLYGFLTAWHPYCFLQQFLLILNFLVCVSDDIILWLVHTSCDLLFECELSPWHFSSQSRTPKVELRAILVWCSQTADFVCLQCSFSLLLIRFLDSQNICVIHIRIVA